MFRLLLNYFIVVGVTQSIVEFRITYPLKTVNAKLIRSQTKRFALQTKHDTTISQFAGLLIKVDSSKSLVEHLNVCRDRWFLLQGVKYMHLVTRLLKFVLVRSEYKIS